MTTEELNKIDKCRNLLDAPAPEVCGELIAEIRRLQRELFDLRSHHDIAPEVQPEQPKTINTPTNLEALPLTNCSASWLPIELAPRDGTYILLAGPSGYNATPLRVEVCKYDHEYRPRNPWVNHSGDAFSDGGAAPTLWMPLPPIPNI